jgi:preprotein translocase subunit SecD
LMVSLLLVWVFMLLYYRLPGILANIALLAHTVIQLLVLSWMGISITLPGMAGIILTIGMGVDANIIIFERIKEELRNGKTLRAAIDVGFKRAFTAVLDANMTTLISAVVLYIFGTGPIQSFAITLGLGVALSFFTAVTASRILLRSVADIDIAKHKWLYGVSVRDTKEVKA